MQHEYRDGTNSAKDKKNKKLKKKDKDSDAEEDANALLLEPEKIENIKENETGSVQASDTEQSVVEKATAKPPPVESRTTVDEKVNDEKPEQKR